jgi:DNA-binding Xre family transcriptional regulator
MTKLGIYLAKRAINKSEVARRTGLSKVRVNELTINENTKLKSSELYLIALAIDVKPSQLLEDLYGDLRLL